jgi:hypothetical protein
MDELQQIVTTYLVYVWVVDRIIKEFSIVCLFFSNFETCKLNPVCIGYLVFCKFLSDASKKSRWIGLEIATSKDFDVNSSSYEILLLMCVSVSWI